MWAMLCPGRAHAGKVLVKSQLCDSGVVRHLPSSMTSLRLSFLIST